MKLLTKKLLTDLPKLGATEKEADPLVRVKFFYPDFTWTWYGIEYDGKDLFWGLVDGYELELGYFLRSELESNKGKLGCSIERDRWFTPTKLSTLRNSLEKLKAA